MDTLIHQPQYGVLSVGSFALPYRIEGRGPAVIVIGDTHYYPRTFSTALRQRLRRLLHGPRMGADSLAQFPYCPVRRQTLAVAG